MQNDSRLTRLKERRSRRSRIPLLLVGIVLFVVLQSCASPDVPETGPPRSTGRPETDWATQIQEKARSIQKLMPEWVKAGGDASRVERFFKEFEDLAKSGKPEEASKKLDEILALLRSSGTTNGVTKPVEGPEKQPRSSEGDRRSSMTRYLLFQIFSGGPNPKTGIFTSGRDKASYEKIVRDMKRDINAQRSSGRRLGFSVGPVVLDQSDEELRQLIKDVFEVAVENDMAVALHLDNYMFWKNARGKDGKKLVDNPKNVEMKDWKGTRSDGLTISWLPSVPLAPQMCLNSPDIKAAVARVATEVIGREVRKGIDRLKAQGKEDLFAGVIAGWETDMVDGYCALRNNGFSATNPPTDFEREREKIVQAYIAWWAKGLRDAGIDRNLIYTHTAHIPRKTYEFLKRRFPPDELRRKFNSTAFKAIWVGFNEYSNPGFSGYPAEGLFEDFYEQLAKHGNPPWAMAEGSNVMLSEGGGSKGSIMDWETYLGKLFNHGATLVNIFGGWQGEGSGPFGQATQSREALAAYRKFLRGEQLKEAR